MSFSEQDGQRENPGLSGEKSLPLTDQVRRRIQEEIRRAGGNEVLFFGWTDGGAVSRIQVVARGNEESVGLPLARSYGPDVVIHNHPDGVLIPSNQDVRISSMIADWGVGFFIVNNDVSESYTVVEPVGRKIRPLDSFEMMKLVSAGSPLSETVSGFEEREEQRQMVAYVCDALNDGSVALIEAGTGIGKSLAYLIPAVHWAVLNGGKVVVSTRTINLQEQLLFKDIPLLKQALGLDFSYTLMKGRGNYICLTRLYEAGEDLFSIIDDDEREQYEALVKWVDTAEEASYSELPFLPKPSLWEKINSQAAACLGSACTYFSRCPVGRARRAAAGANLIVTNHHYLLADAQLALSGGALIPPYKRVIFDEAHNLEDSATSFFTRNVTLSSVLRLLNRLYSGNGKKGYLVYLIKKRLPGAENTVSKVRKTLQSLRSAAYDFFKMLEHILDSAEGSRDSQVRVLELNEEMKEMPLWKSTVSGSMRSFYGRCSSAANELQQVRERYGEAGDERTVRQVDGFINQFLEITRTIDIFLGEDDAYVRWIQRKREAGIFTALIEVGDLLKERVFNRMETCVLTSATLTVQNSFHFIKSRLGLPDPAIEAHLDSPFDYDAQMMTLIPADIPQPDHPEFPLCAARIMDRVLDKTGGRAFILFTSHKTLNEVHGKLREKLDGRFLLLKQGDESRRNLLETFKTDVHSVLFGTESFWEGVDAPGSTLECVVITKLPFKVPSEPIIRARLERIQARGENPFLEYYVPLAAIKMKQGVGRLIRNRTDRGIVLILDKRIILKSYGRIFLDTMPTGNVFQGPMDEIVNRIEAFLAITP